MSDNTSIPILLDGDTGYGNFNNARRLVRKLEQRGVAGVCIEDKLFPKTNSLLEGVSQPLADIDEFCGKIQACKDAQKDDAFSGTLPPPISVRIQISFFHLSISSSWLALHERAPSTWQTHFGAQDDTTKGRNITTPSCKCDRTPIQVAYNDPECRGSSLTRVAVPPSAIRWTSPPTFPFHFLFSLLSLILIVLFMFECWLLAC
jgi:hypothetical protein